MALSLLDARRSEAPPAPPRGGLEPPPLRALEYQGEEGVIERFDRRALERLAYRHDVTLDAAHGVGEHLFLESALFTIAGVGPGPEAAGLHRCVRVGRERSLAGDPLYAIRLLVDIASRALSPAVNDPTTAVTGLDAIHGLLFKIGLRDLRADGRSPVRLQEPGWEDFVRLGCSEVRAYGRSSLAVLRRMQAMLGDLAARLPEERRAPLLEQQALLEEAIDLSLPDAKERATARQPDYKGLG